LGKPRVLSGRQVCSILGSHIVMQKRFPDRTLTVPIPDHSELRIGTLQSIIRQSGVSRSEFES
jgi:predicted RNA binding protein YcfA (HicA-like mRNA interferase family)